MELVIHFQFILYFVLQDQALSSEACCSFYPEKFEIIFSKLSSFGLKKVDWFLAMFINHCNFHYTANLQSRFYTGLETANHNWTNQLWAKDIYLIPISLAQITAVHSERILGTKSLLARSQSNWCSQHMLQS